MILISSIKVSIVPTNGIRVSIVQHSCTKGETKKDPNRLYTKVKLYRGGIVKQKIKLASIQPPR